MCLKANIMNQPTHQQEILLFTNTRFASKDYQKVGKEETHSDDSKIERLKEACWNGLLTELLPEILEDHSNKKINLWNINVASTFLDLQFSAYPSATDELFSVNPYIFLQHQYLN